MAYRRSRYGRRRGMSSYGRRSRRRRGRSIRGYYMSRGGVRL